LSESRSHRTNRGRLSSFEHAEASRTAAEIQLLAAQVGPLVNEATARMQIVQAQLNAKS
jgi:hypothetical protein